jgi:3-oxoacyl-[acyl-carrier protein] reductase
LDLRLEGKRALVTAASRGLGLACAQALVEERARVAFGARNASRLEGITNRLSRQAEATPVEMDLNVQQSIQSAVDTVVGRWGGLDILIINTPGPPSGPFLSLGRDVWRSAIDMIVMPVIDVLHSALPIMKRSGGRVLFITTVGVKVVQPHMVLSNATRLALTGIAKTLSVELADSKILVNSLCPGPIDTDRMAELIRATSAQQNVSLKEAEAIWLNEVPLARMGSAADFGRLAAVLVSDVASFVTGTALAIDGGKARAY